MLPSHPHLPQFPGHPVPLEWREYKGEDLEPEIGNILPCSMWFYQLSHRVQGRASDKDQATTVPWHGSASLVPDGGEESTWSCAGLSLVCLESVPGALAHPQRARILCDWSAVSGSRAAGWLWAGQHFLSALLHRGTEYALKSAASFKYFMQRRRENL